MPFRLAPFRRFPMQCSVIYNAGPFQGQGTVWNLFCTGWRLSADLPMRPGEAVSLTVTLPNGQCRKVPEALVWWSKGQEFVVAVFERRAVLHTRGSTDHDGLLED